MHRFQFSTRTLFWLTLVVAAFLSGMAAQYRMTTLQATKREQKLEREIRGLKAEIRLQTEQTKHLEFRIGQMQEQQIEAQK